MDMTVARRISRLPDQFFSGLTRQVAKVQAQGHDVINLGQGNPDLPTPPHIVEALRKTALDPRTHRYSPFRGLSVLKEAAAAFYERTYGVKVHPEREVAILFGGKAGLVEMAELYLEEGDLALVPDPGYPDYMSGIALTGASPRLLPLTTENAYMPRLDDISADEWERAKLWYVNYPSNPTGAGVSPAFFDDVIAHAKRHNVIVVHDFAYGAIGYDGVRPPSFMERPGAKEIGVEIYTLSKTYNMAGWRIGFAIGNEEIISALNLIQDHYYVSIFPAVQLAAAAALEGDQRCVEELRLTYEDRRDAFVKVAADNGLTVPPPSGSFFCWVPLPFGHDSVQFANDLLIESHVAVAPGRGFGETGEGFIRIGLLTDVERLEQAAVRMGRFVRNHHL